MVLRYKYVPAQIEQAAALEWLYSFSGRLWLDERARAHLGQNTHGINKYWFNVKGDTPEEPIYASVKMIRS